MPSFFIFSVPASCICAAGDKDDGHDEPVGQQMEVESKKRSGSDSDDSMQTGTDKSRKSRPARKKNERAKHKKWLKSQENIRKAKEALGLDFTPWVTRRVLSEHSREAAGSRCDPSAMGPGTRCDPSPDATRPPMRLGPGPTRPDPRCDSSAVRIARTQ